MRVYDKIQNMSPEELAKYLLDEVVNSDLCLKCSQTDCSKCVDINSDVCLRCIEIDCSQCDGINRYDIYKEWLLSDEI